LILGRSERTEILAIARTEKRTEILETEKILARRFALWEFHLEELLGSETASAE